MRSGARTVSVRFCKMGIAVAVILPGLIQLNEATPLPVVCGPLPVAAVSYPFGAADHTRVPTDLKRIGYIEEVFLSEGKANVYEWLKRGVAVVRAANAQYTTRTSALFDERRAKWIPSA